mmetsp:Transcript_5083/g.7771  ORF Transcript_5083/g.7771 Transcript_5083/m.7771 type:complete len:555 (+) Transcript_5083:155-1819(+)|eukprot:CAMPEP_0185038122 /NCGR_PEP_ID=MMETSP1103-20130426/33391_1 /TAXON_ID=36769 /ORGANISM="Paraphysomonas bandaiensis, Strain Caron Lab Isolate" /LENGTH=554 /DNA_ID=CAMNT_0027576409 /DNA_START=118 /DNA_END=1782 /DNA_ORIENTATION=-
MGNGHVTRYIGGKRPLKYFTEDLWPSSESSLRKLNIDEARGFEIFKLFCRIDTDESASLEVDECMSYFGGKRTRFTERIFDTIRTSDEETGLDFIHFTFTVWNYCTLNTAGIARYVFEIFDPDNNGYLEQPDVEAMYRMLYDTEDHDTKHIRAIKFDPTTGRIAKDKFMKHMKSKKFVIRPALEYQNRMRRNLGGVIMWEGLTGYRKRHFSVYDSKCTTLEESFVAILAAPDPNVPETQPDSRELLERERSKLMDSVTDAKQRMKEFQRYQEDEKRKSAMKMEDRAVQLAWMAFEAKKYQFESMHFGLDDIWARQEERNAVYEVFDEAVAVQNRYWEERGRKEEFTAYGSESDREARIRDVLRTEEGQMDRERVKWILILEAALKRVAIQAGNSEKAQNDVANLEAQLSKLRDGSTNFHPAKKLSQKFTKKYDLEDIEERTDKLFAEVTIEKAIAEMRESRKESEEERLKDIKRKEFDIATKYGSRNTRWETVNDYDNNRIVTINVDTLKVLDPKAVICELCDAIIEQNDFRCYQCNALRSAKNTPFFKPLGAL